MNRYAKMYGWLYEVFEKDRFTMDEFRAIFPSPQHPKTIHDLVRLGYLKRVIRGEYRVTEPIDHVRGMVEVNLEKREVLTNARRKYAFSDDDAVRIWTDGYYWTGFTRGFKPIHIRIRTGDLGYWREFFSNLDVEHALEDESRTMFGVTYILHPVRRLKIETKEGISVIPLKDAVEFCRMNEFTYRPALEYLDKEYGLELFDQYEHVH